MAAAEADGEPRARAAALIAVADAHQCQTSYRRAIDHYVRALGLARQGGWLDGQSAALGNLGMVYWQLGRLEEAAEHHTRSLAIDRRIGAVARQAVALSNLGSISWELGRLAEAADHYARALAIHEHVGPRRSEAVDLAGLGEAQLASTTTQPPTPIRPSPSRVKPATGSSKVKRT